MHERKIRIQILIDPIQRERIEAIARHEGVSISAVTQKVIETGLDCLGNEGEVWNNRARLLSRLRSMREKQPMAYAGDLVNECRQERQDDGDRLWLTPSSSH